MNEELSDKLGNKDSWKRIALIVLFALVLYVAAAVVMLVVAVHIAFTLFTGERNDRVQAFGASLSEYIAQVLRFVTYTSDTMPFPFADWPPAPPVDAPAAPSAPDTGD